MLQHGEFVGRLKNFELTTQRLRLRRLTPADDHNMVEHEMNPAIMAMIRDPQQREDVIQKIAEFGAPWDAKEDSWVGLAVEELDTGSLTGFFFFRVVSYENQSLELGYRFHPDFWRLGYASEAGQQLMAYFADELKIRKVVAYCVAENEGSARVLEKLGFDREGCLKQHSFLGGKWCDELVYGKILAK